MKNINYKFKNSLKQNSSKKPIDFLYPSYFDAIFVNKFFDIFLASSQLGSTKTSLIEYLYNFNSAGNTVGAKVAQKWFLSVFPDLFDEKNLKRSLYELKNANIFKEHISIDLKTKTKQKAYSLNFDLGEWQGKILENSLQNLKTIKADQWQKYKTYFVERKAKAKDYWHANGGQFVKYTKNELKSLMKMKLRGLERSAFGKVKVKKHARKNRHQPQTHNWLAALELNISYGHSSRLNKPLSEGNFVITTKKSLDASSNQLKIIGRRTRCALTYNWHPCFSAENKLPGMMRRKKEQPSKGELSLNKEKILELNHRLYDQNNQKALEARKKTDKRAILQAIKIELEHKQRLKAECELDGLFKKTTLKYFKNERLPEDIEGLEFLAEGLKKKRIFEENNAELIAAHFDIRRVLAILKKKNQDKQLVEEKPIVEEVETPIAEEAKTPKKEKYKQIGLFKESTINYYATTSKDPLPEDLADLKKIGTELLLGMKTNRTLDHKNACQDIWKVIGNLGKTQKPPP